MDKRREGRRGVVRLMYIILKERMNREAASQNRTVDWIMLRFDAFKV